MRTINEIYNSIIAEKESNVALTTLDPSAGENATALLSELSSGSKVAIWRLIFWITAVAIWFLENIFDLHVKELTALSETFVTGTPRWYYAKCLEFQFGDVLIYDSINYRFNYSPINTANQIVKRCAILDLGGLVSIKVAKLSSGNPVPLTVPELASFSYYVNLIKFAGTNVNIISIPADLMKIYLSVVIDPLVLLPNGESIANAGTFPVADAVDNYIKNLPFNGILNLTFLVDSLQTVSGVTNPVVVSADAKTYLSTYTTIDRVVGYTPASGYINIDPGFPLSTTITYL